MAATVPAELWRTSAVAAVELLKTKQVTPLQLVEVAEQRWKETDPFINAMPITCWERAKQHAQRLMEQGYPDSPPRGYLYGLPIAVKDLTAVKGLPFTQGSLLFKDRIAQYDDPLVQRLEEKGAIIVGKTNTPELGAGSQTYNKLYGTTVNPWDTSKTSGGSSGGSAAALAVGQVWLATGTDLGGSLRNPASFCGVVGMRNTVGLVPQAAPAALLLDETQPAWRLRSVSGLLARSVEDLALGFDAVVGEHEQDPMSLPAPEQPFSAAISSSTPQTSRIAFSADLGGITPVCSEVVQVCRTAADWWRQQGAQVVDDQPDLTDAADVFQIIRAFIHKPDSARLLGDADVMRLLKPELVWQLQAATQVTQEQIEWAVAAHDKMLANVQQFFQQYDLLLCPTVMMQPFDASIHWPTEFEGTKFPTYIDWMKTCSAISPLGLPAISIPCGLSKSGLPIGLQIVGPPGADAAVLAAAAAFERAHKYREWVPMNVVNKHP